jgi:hypothetical protein
MNAVGIPAAFFYVFLMDTVVELMGKLGFSIKYLLSSHF